MPTIREAMQAEVDRLRTQADAIEAKLKSVEPSLANVLEHDAAAVASFFRAFGEHIFGHKPAAAPAPDAQPTAPATTAAQ
ncbi:MAG TPA: hypothetical protein VF453_06650 [Burkholderiaceae bacterium]